MTSSLRLLQAVLVAALLIPALLFGAAAWQNRRDVTREGEDMVLRTCAVMQEHARKVFETAELAIGRVDDRVEDESWSTIDLPETSAFLAKLKAPMEQLVSLWVSDSNGVLRAGSQPWRPGLGIEARAFFQDQRSAAIGLSISPVFFSLATQTASFAVTRRRTTPDGAFDGTVHASISPAYFSRFYAEAAPPGEHIATLILDSGAVLARQPVLAGYDMLAPDNPVLQTIASGHLEGVHRGVGHIGLSIVYAVQRVGAYPAYVVFALPEKALLRRWHQNVAMYGVVAAAAALTLLMVSWLALRRAQAEQTALVRLEESSRQRLAAEQALRHSQRMDAVGQLTGGVAHDFNNLLTAILGNLELIQRAARQPDSAARIDRLSTTAMKAVNRGAKLTKSLLAFARKQPLMPETLDANALVREFMDLLRQAVGPGIEIVFEPGADLPHCVADPAELEAALLNLVINARDAMEGSGLLRLSTGRVWLDAAALEGNTEAAPGGFVAIGVTDGGGGMAPEVAAKAFEPFFTTKPVGKGTGLGLSQVYGFVRQLGGHVAIASAAGQGTTVTLFLPVAPV